LLGKKEKKEKKEKKPKKKAKRLRTIKNNFMQEEETIRVPKKIIAINIKDDKEKKDEKDYEEPINEEL